MITSIQGRPRRTLAALLLVGAGGLGLAAAGCGDNSGQPTGYFPEGQTSGAILLTDIQPFDAETTSVYVAAFVAGPPPADGYRFYVDPGGEGFRPATDAPIPPSTTFDSGWSLFNTVLDGYDPTTTWHALQARSSRRGIESTSSDLTALGYLPHADPLTLARRLPITLLAPDDSAQISEPNFDWAPVPGATQYLLQGFAASGGELGFLVHFNDATKTATLLDVGAQGLIPYNWFVTGYDQFGNAIARSPQRMVSFGPGAGTAPGAFRIRGVGANL